MAGVPRASRIPDYGPAGTINYDSEVYSEKSGCGELIVTMWWAEQRGLG